MATEKPTEHNLDPADWDAMRQLGHRMVDDMFEYLQTLPDRPVWTPTPASVKAAIQMPLPTEPTSPEVIYERFREWVLPYPKGNIHPRFFSWVQGNGTLLGMLADMLASGLNPNVSIGDHSAMYVDQQVISWCKELFGFPAGAGGMLVSGGTIANLVAMIVARNAYQDGVVKQQGLYAHDGQLVVYGSTETHNCLDKAVQTIGIGLDNYRKIAVDSDFRIQLPLLREQIRRDRAAGMQPFCIIGNCGTVNTGAIDPLDELLALARAEKLWFHVDGAFGSLAKLAPAYAQQLQAIEAADSLAFDLHKWLYVNYEVGGVLIRREELQRQAFTQEASYLVQHERGLAAGPPALTSLGPELSRGFKALKVWMSFQEHGLEKYRQLIQQNIGQALYLGDQIMQNPPLELLTPVTLNIVCYRYNPGGLSSEQLNALNKELLMQLQEKGVAAPSYTVLNGQYAIRVNITNHRTRTADLDALVEGSLLLGKTIFPARG